MNELAKRLGVFVIGNLIVFGALSVMENLMNGKDILGRKKKAKKNNKTTVDWNGDIRLGPNDYQVV